MTPKGAPPIYTRIYSEVKVSMTFPKSSSLMMSCSDIKNAKYLNYLFLSLYLSTSTPSKALKFFSFQRPKNSQWDNLYNILCRMDPSPSPDFSQHRSRIDPMNTQ